MIKLNNYKFSYQTMMRSLQIIALLCLVTGVLGITGIGLNPIRPLHLNKGKITKYLFYIDPEVEITSNAQVKITFPSEFNMTALAAKLSCHSSSPSYSWKQVPCTYSQGSVFIRVWNIKNEQLNILVSSPQNPTIFDMSSSFSVCLMVSSMTMSCSKTFGKVVFPDSPTPTNSSAAIVSSLNTLIVGQSSTYQVQFSLIGSYTAGNTVRVTFPPGFLTSSTPICQMKGTYNQVIATFVWPDQRTIQCQNINKTLGTGQTLKIIGLSNPSYSGVFGNSQDGFKVEILKQTTTIVLEQIYLQSTITITPGTLTGSISQENNFILGDVRYTFYLNILNSLTSSNFILIKFPSTWTLYENQCQVISGITMNPKTKLNCSNSTGVGSTILNVSNFVSASVSNQLVFNTLVRSPITPNSYNVIIQTRNIDGIVDTMTTSISINGTYGDYDMLSINAIVAQSDVPVSGTGPLQLTFFLNYQLPQTNVLTSGKFIIKIYPQIPLPPPLVNGVLKCYFFKIYPAKTCLWDTATSASYTLLTIFTPETIAYQYSQIPITVTTEGAISSSKIGITIADIVTRYRFEVQAFQHNSSVVPTEVYFSEYIAAPIYLPVTSYALTKQVNQYTHFRFEFDSPYNFTTPLADDLRIKIQFLGGGAWASNLGYNANTIYKRFPCVFSDNRNQKIPPQYNSDVTCDLYTYLDGPHASLTNAATRGPYILVSGFTNYMFIASQVRLELGKFLIGSSTNLQAKIRFSLIQQTPTMLTKYVELYYNQFTAFTTSVQNKPTAGSGTVTDSISNSQINAVSQHTFTYTAPSTFFATIYEFDQISTPSFANAFIQCTTQSVTVANWCTTLGYPANYIVQYSFTTFTTSVNSVLNFTNGVYAGTFPGRVRLFSAAGVTLYKENFNVVYNPYTITVAHFLMDTSYVNPLFKGSQSYFQLRYRPIGDTPTDGFIRLIFASGMQLGQKPFCQSSYVTPYIAQLGLICTIQSSTSLKISNINSHSAGTDYYITVRLASLISTTSSISPTVTMQTHYSINADPSIVNKVDNVGLSPGQTNNYNLVNTFKLDNPQIAFQIPRVGYIGKFQIKINPSSDVLTSNQIKIILNNHAWNTGYWSTPNQALTDPLVCLINSVRVPCTFTLLPLTVTMSVSPAGITANQQNIITLDTQYLVPYNGIRHPSIAGEYNCHIQFLDSGSTIIQQQSFYHRVMPAKLTNIYMESYCNDVNAENMFYIQFQIGAQAVNANNNGATYSRIYVEFPTVDSNNNPLFANNLGGYTKTGQLVGCAFDTWTTYYVSSVTDRLKCRLIMSEVPGEPARVEIINHNSFSGNYVYMRLWIAKVFNPAAAVTSVPISIKIDHVAVTTNDITELYYDTFHLFMNSQSNSPTVFQTSSCRDVCNCDIFSSEINNRNSFLFYTNSLGSFDANIGFFYAIDMTSALTPRSLQDEWNNNDCHSSYYYYCLSFPDINYFIIKSKSSNAYRMYLHLQTTGALSQATTNLVAKVWYNQRYRGTHTLQLSQACWDQLRGDFGSISISSTAYSNTDRFKNKRRSEVQISFVTEYYIPSTGTVLIKFPSTIPRIYPHCRSMNNLGSDLYAQGTSENGEIGCLVQNTREWAITGFNALNGGSTIIIVGFVDYPSTNGNIGTGQIISFNNTHATNIRVNGFMIDYWSGDFGLQIVDGPSLNIDGQIVLQQTLPLRVGFKGPLQFKFKLPSTLTGPNAGKITVRVPVVSTMGVTGGFNYVSASKHVCQIKQIDTFQETGCIITSISVDSSLTFPNYMFTMITSDSLSSGNVYKLSITTHTGSQPEGLTFPTVAGTYKVDFNFDTTGSTSFAIHDHLYLEVYGTKFTFLQVIAMCTIPSIKNLLWIKVTPTTTIQTTQQLVIEIPTKGIDGNLLYANNLGMTYANGTSYGDGDSIPYDMLNAFSQSFMVCRLFHGDQTNGKPAKIVCGSFQSAITNSQTLFFAITVVNPGPTFNGVQVSIPFFIYSYEQGTLVKTNFDVIENAILLRKDYDTRASDWIDLYSQNQRQQTPGVFVDMITRNTANIGKGDYYVILFNFPLRNNGVVSSGCSYPGGGVYGDAYYHQNLWIIVCLVTHNTNYIGVPGDGHVTRNLRISNFYTPFYYLQGSELAMLTYSYYFSSKRTSVGYVYDGFPNQSPKRSGDPTYSLTPIHQSPKYTGSRDDYTITFTYSASASVDISFTKLIAVIFPASIDYAFYQSDCVQSPSSQVQIASCYIDTADRVIYITPVVKSSYLSNMAVSITTRNLAVRNPTNTNSFDINNFVIKYYTWQNITQPSVAPRSNNIYCFLIIDNLGSSTVSFSYNPHPYSVNTFSYMHTPHQRYYQQTPFSNLVHRAPLEMEFYTNVVFNGQSGTNYNMVRIVYGSAFSDASVVKIRDLQVFRPVCYLNNQRIRLCTIDTTNKHITMSFLFGLAVNTRYHLKVSILDSRNADINGFLPTSAVSNIVLMYKRNQAGSTWSYTETDQFPTLYSLPSSALAGPFRGIIAGTPTYGHTIASQLNFVNLLLTFNRTDITGLVFEIVSKDKAGTNLFGSQSDLTTTFMSQADGGSYPCGNNGLSAGGSVRCILLKGQFSNSNNAGTPSRIIMTGFTYATQMNCRFVFVNPPTVGAYFSVMVRAFGGTATALNPYGNQYMGFWQFNEIFQVASATIDYNTRTATSYKCPSQSPWRNSSTVYVFSRSQVIGNQRSAIAQVKLFDSSLSAADDLLCEAQLYTPAANQDDLLQYTLLSGGTTTKYAYFITTFQGNTNVAYTNPTVGWSLSYLKCKYYAPSFSVRALFFFSDTSVEIATNSFGGTHCNGNTPVISQPISKYFSQNYYINDGTDTVFVHQIDITPAYTQITNFNFRNGDAMVMSITYGYSYWGTIKSCNVLGGIISTSINTVATCSVASSGTSTTQIYITNIGGFLANPLLATTTNYRVKIMFVGDVISTSITAFNFDLNLYPNIDGYTSQYQSTINHYNALTGATPGCYYSSPGTCTYGQGSSALGTFQVLSLSDTFMSVAFSPNSGLNFGASTSYIHQFLVTFNGFNFGPTCTINSVIFQFSTSMTPGTGTNNTFPINSATCSQTNIDLIFQYRAFADFWGGSAAAGQAKNGWYNPGEYVIFYITISPSPSARDLPSLQHQFLFIQGSYNYRTTGGWTSQVQRSYTMPSQPLAASATFSTLSNNINGVTELSFQVTSLNVNIGPQNTGFSLLVEFIGTSGWSDPFGTYTNTAITNDYIACKCFAGASPLTVSVSSPLVDANCIRRLPTGSFNNYAILVNYNAQKTQDLICFFPQFKITSSMSFSAEFKLIYGDSYPPQLSGGSTKYSSLYRVMSNTLTFSTTPAMPSSAVTVTQTPDFYNVLKFIGTTFTGSYNLTGSWGANLNSPLVYINFLSAGPIPIYSFCSDSNVFLQCRVYTSYVYVIVARLKSTSVSSFTLINGANSLLYPPSQTSLSNYGLNVYVGTGSWQYLGSRSRTSTQLSPLSSNSLFRIYSDQYGSTRATYNTLLFFSFNPNGQSLFNNILTGSQLVISWSSLTTTTNCQVWVQNEPLVNLVCVSATNSLTVTSPYFDYSTTNNIIISVGLTNPSSASTTFDAKLYSYYYSGSRFSLTISTSNTYTTDITYTSSTKLAKGIVQMYPFQARISTVANAPLRIRFQIPSGSIDRANGRLDLIYSQIQYSGAHYCYLIKYNDYTSMMQQTQRTIYRTSSCTSSSTTIYVTPPSTLTLATSVYYELVLLPLGMSSCSGGCVTQSGYHQTNFDQINLIAYSNVNSGPGIIAQQVNKLYAYEGSSFIGLQQIYILCTEPRITSLHISMNINFTSSNNFPNHYLEITLYELGIAQFPSFSIGSIFPCQLSSNFIAISNRQLPQCRVVSGDLLNSFVTVRIENIGFLSPQIYWVSLDDILLPNPGQSDNNKKFDIAIAYYGPSNLKYFNYFPEIFQIDASNTATPTTNSVYTFNNPSLTGFGNSVVGQVSFSWPFDSSSHGYESKIALNINGGYASTWANIDSVTFVDALGSYQILWVNKKLNKFVFAIPNKGPSISTILNITSLSNPYPYQRQSYEFNSTNMIINFYNTFFLSNSRTFSQPVWGIFTRNPSLIFINQNLPSNTIDNYPSTNTFAPSSLNTLRLSITFDETPANILARNLGNIMIKFTSGISYIRDCRAMRNSSLFVNTEQVCQAFYDGSNWQVKIYRFANSELNTGWYVQILANFNAATLTYTSYAMASNNLQVEYQSTYTISLTAYSAARSICTKLSWMNNKYITNFHETQVKFLQAITGQSTQYLKFRFTAPYSSSTVNDIFYIYLPDDQATQPFAPKTSGSNLIGQFLPATGDRDRDFSIGSFSECTLFDVGSNYQYRCYMRYGGLISGNDYLFQLSQYNTATSSFYMPTAPGRREVRFMYNFYPSVHNWQYYDSTSVRYYRFFKFAQFLHTTTTINDYESIRINYRPNGALSAFSSTQQIGLRLSVQARYRQNDGGITSIYTADSKVLLSGSRFSGAVSNPGAGNPQIVNIQFSQYAIENAPLRFVLTKQQAYTDNTLYYWIVPLLKNPGTAFIALRYNLTLVVSPASSQQYIFNHYESINQYYTVADTSTSFTTSITNNLRSVQTVSAVDLSVNMATYSLAQWNTAIFKLNNALPGLIQNIASPNDTANYDYYYFNVINMIMAQKKSTNSITTIGIGSSSSVINYQSTFGISWVRVFNNLNTPQATNPYTLLYSTPPTLTLTHLASYSASSISLIQGLQTQGSAAMYKVTFTTPILPAGGEIRILFDTNVFTSLSGGSCRPNTNLIKSGSQNDVFRCYRVSEGLILAGFSAKTAGSSVAAYIMLKSRAVATSSPISVDLFGIYQDNTTRISLANVGTITHTSGTAPTALYRQAQTVNPYFSSIRSTRYRTFEGIFNLRTLAITNTGFIQFAQPAYLGFESGGARRLLIKQNVSSVTGWTQCAHYYSSSPYYRFSVPVDYLMTQTVAINIDYIFRYTIHFSDPTYSRTNGFYDNSGGANRIVSSRIWIKTYDNSAWRDVGYYDFVYYPEPIVLTIRNRYTAATRQTVLDLSWTNNIDIPTGSSVVVTFDTHSLLYSMFANDVEGTGANGATYRYLDCRQWLGINEISASRIKCILNFGNSLANPPIPANLTIKFTTYSYGWSSNEIIRLLVANVKNPSTVGMNVGVTVNAFIPCTTQQNQQCSGNTARGYYVTSASNENVQSTATTFSSSSNLVLATSLTHTFTLTLTAQITTDHAIYIVYPENFQGVMPDDCSCSGYNCFVFPTRRWVVLYPTGTISSGPRTISISPMNNPYYAQAASQYFLVTVARSFNGIVGDTYQILQNPFTPVSYSFQNTGQATSLTISATQTPNMYLRNYANTVIFTISKIFSDSRAKAIYIMAPSDVTSWDPTYCNASITTTQTFAYPLRFTCAVDPATPLYLRLTLDSDMPTFSNSWGLLNIRLHARFTLANFSPSPTLYVTQPLTSGSFFAYSSVSATSSSSIYYMSQSSATVSISQNQVPVISVINFNTKSFSDRQARVNNKEVFYMLFKPLVNVNFGSIVFTIPSEFNYPGVFQFDNCLMIGRTTIQQPDCQLSRSQGQTLVTMKPTGYDNNVKILQIGTVSETNWFTAPSLPGNFYKMNVAVYSSTGTLISKQTRHISPVYGASLDIPSISIKNIQDTNIKLSVYDLTFVTGTLQIPPGAPTTATTQTSQLQFIFENYNGMNPTNVFDNDLKTGLTTGSQVGCKIFSGLTALPGLRIKCLLYVGTNSTDKPKIRIINYNFINPATTIIVGFAGIQSLPTTLVNTISIGAIIYYTDIDSWTYLYIPTPIVTIPTNATNMYSSMPAGWVSGWAVNASYSGTNIVLQPTVFTISFTCPYWYWQDIYGNWLYNYAYASTGADSQFILLTFYPPTLLDKNNPIPVTCASCTSVDVYYASGTVRFRHTTSTTSQIRAFQFNNFPTSAYSMLNKTVSVYFQVFEYYQAVYQRNVTVNLSRTVEKCTKFSFGVVSVSSLNGGEIGVTYLFSIQTNHFVPANGAISITIPSVYGNMIDNLATCTLRGFNNTNCYCTINTPYRVDIYMNGTQLLAGNTYSIEVTGLQNPNIASSNFVFIVTSYYESNIYLGLKICENQIIPPSINVKPLRTCKLSWTPQYYNQNFNTTYAFQLSCSDVFRGDSILYINLPTAFSTTNSLGTVPCSSYQSTTLLQPVCNIQSIDGVFTITTSIDASSQSSLSLILNLVNPINNTYSANAYVTSKGTQYASSGNSSLTILSNSYAKALSTHVQLLNLPKQAGLMATYIFKIAPMSNFTPTNLGISFPSNFNIDSASVNVAIFNNAKNNIFSLLTYNNIQALINNVTTIAGAQISSYPDFSVDGTSIYLRNIGNQVSSTLWTYVFVSNIQNPSAYVYANFTVAYYLISSGFQALQWIYQYPLTYYINSPPGFLSITSVTVNDYDLLYPAIYTFKFSTNNGGFIGIAGKALSYVIVIPTSYKSTLWANNAPICKFNQKATPSDCEIYQGEIIVNEQFSTNLTSLTLTISFLLNPSLPTYCDTTDTSVLSATFFKIRIIDTLSSTFVFESSSVVDGSNCLAFSAVRIPISVQYSLIMTAGLAYNITYGLTKPSSNLKITSYVDNSGFTFSPVTVDFNNFYDLTKSTQLFLRSDVSPGTYVIYFNKSQSTNLTSFRNILPVTITVVASSDSIVSAPTIRIPSMTDSTVGYPVKIPVKFSLPSSTQMTLFMSILEQQTKTLSQYYHSFANFSLTPDIINIQPQETEYEYILTYKSRIVPPPLTLNFKLTSNYPIVHNLVTPQMYLCFDRDPRYNVLYPPLRVRVTQFLTSCNLQDVGKIVTNIFVSSDRSESSASFVTPKIISLSVESVASTGAVIKINSISAGTIYFACLPVGYPEVTDVNELAAMKIANSVSGQTVSQSLTVSNGNTAQINYIASATITNLNQSSNYIFYAISQNNLGTSSIKSITFMTTLLSKSVKFTICLTQIVDKLDIVSALVETLRIKPMRIRVLTSPYDLNLIANSVTSSKNKPKYNYDIVLAPDSGNDIVPPLESIRTFAESTTLLNKFDKLIPSFDINTKIIYFQLRPSVPEIKSLPTPVKITHNKASFKIQFKAQTDISVIIMEQIGGAPESLTGMSVSQAKKVKDLPNDEKGKAPFSSQIKSGKDFGNNKLGKYKILNVLSDERGFSTLEFQDLKQKSIYTMYITASSPSIMGNDMLWPDSDVLVVQFSTLPNPNVGNADRQKTLITQFAVLNPKLGEQMLKFIQMNQQKSQTKKT